MSGSSAMSVSGIRFLWYGLSTLLPMRSWLVGAMMVGLVGAAAQPAPRPNVVVFLADDQGWGDLGISGNTNLSTPHIDSLARDGAMLPHFFVSPVCSPTRAEFLTGRYYPRGGVYGTSARAERLDLDETTIAQTFKAAGYATAAFGKWHNGSQYPYHPNGRGFDEYYGFTRGTGDSTSARRWRERHAGRRQGLHHRRPDRTGHGVHRAATAAGRSSAYIPYNTPHSPMQVPERFYDKFARRGDSRCARQNQRRKILPTTRAALAMGENIDWNVGRVLAQLDELRLARDTIVIYFSDNGPAAARWNAGLKGRKGSLDEGGVRSPFLIRWPQRIRPGTTLPQIASAVDLLPTLAALAGIPVVGTKPLDGKSIEPLLMGSSAPWPDRTLFAFGLKGQVSVRTERYRLDPAGQLFDLVADPGQRIDVGAAHPQIASELRAAADAMRGAVPGNAAADTRPLPVGDRQRTELPAGDATVTGSVQRSNRFPNSSYFTAWSNTDAVVTWDVEVLQPGDYEVVAYYACAAADVGSVIEVAFGDKRVTATIGQAHDPPVIGAAETGCRASSPTSRTSSRFRSAGCTSTLVEGR